MYICEPFLGVWVFASLLFFLYSFCFVWVRLWFSLVWLIRFGMLYCFVFMLSLVLFLLLLSFSKLLDCLLYWLICIVCVLKIILYYCVFLVYFFCCISDVFCITLLYWHNANLKSEWIRYFFKDLSLTEEFQDIFFR